MLKIIKEISGFYRKSEFSEQIIKFKILYLLVKISSNWIRVKIPCRTHFMSEKGIFGIYRTDAITAGYEPVKNN